MPEPPDFEQIARRMITDDELDDDVEHAAIYLRIAEQLRQAWNARGTADMELIAAEFASGRCPQRDCPMEAPDEAPAINLGRALSKLDR